MPETQLELTEALPRRFDGETYSHEHDGKRLSAQYDTVFNLMKDGKARSLEDIGAMTKFPQQSVSARLRDMRKLRFGSHTVQRKNMGDGLWLYTLIVNPAASAA